MAYPGTNEELESIGALYSRGEPEGCFKPQPHKIHVGAAGGTEEQSR